MKHQRLRGRLSGSGASKAGEAVRLEVAIIALDKRIAVLRVPGDGAFEITPAAPPHVGVSP